MFTVDGNTWGYPCDIERVSEVTASDISGMLMDKSYFNDVIGTYLKYTVTMVVPPEKLSEYNIIYETLTEPVDAHSFVLPYGSNTVTITGRVKSISDIYKRMPGGATYWKGIKFTIIADHPTKTRTLGQAIQRGLAPLPEVADASTGDLYEKTAGGWEKVVYPNADDIAY